MRRFKSRNSRPVQRKEIVWRLVQRSCVGKQNWSFHCCISLQPNSSGLLLTWDHILHLSKRFCCACGPFGFCCAFRWMIGSSKSCRQGNQLAFNAAYGSLQCWPKHHHRLHMIGRPVISCAAMETKHREYKKNLADRLETMLYSQDAKLAKSALPRLVLCQLEAMNVQESFQEISAWCTQSIKARKCANFCPTISDMLWRFFPKKPIRLFVSWIKTTSCLS